MNGKITKQPHRLIAVRVPIDVANRLLLESARRNQSMQTVVTTALDNELPRSIKIVVGKDDRRGGGSR